MKAAQLSSQHKVESTSKLTPKKLHASAPARLGGPVHTQTSRGTGASDSCRHQQSQEWRFVNRYAHRSNGGIPMFSEERLKERAEKV